MHFALSLVVVGAVIALWAQLCTRIVAWQRGREDERPDRPRRVRVPRQRRAPSLPEGHRPPPGLGPLSPSERFLTGEAARGLRELQLFLVDQQAA